MIELRKPSMEFILSYLEFIHEMKTLGEKIWAGQLPAPGESNEKFVENLLRLESSPPPEVVRKTIYWAIQGNSVVGRIGLHHYLNNELKEFGGHIGYEVRPSCRNQGIAKEILRQLLQTPKAKEIGHLLLTCSPDNIASNKTILANGGVLKETKFVEKWARNTNYYWIIP